MAIRVYIDVTGIDRFAMRGGAASSIRKLIIGCLEAKGLDPVLLIESARFGVFSIVVPELFKEGYTGSGSEQIAIDEMGNGTVFLDFCLEGRRLWRRSGLLPLLKRQGVKVLAFFSGVGIISEPWLYDENIVMRGLDYFGAVIKHADYLLCTDGTEAEQLKLITEEAGNKSTHINEVNSSPKMVSLIKSVVGSVRQKARTDIRQMVILTARVDDIRRTLPFVDAFMPYIEEVVLCCPDFFLGIKEEIYQGRLKLSLLTDSELLAGEPLPVDHRHRNFYLRSLAVQSDKLDEVFIMSDDDYRPLFEVPKNFWVGNGKYKAYYMFDLCNWLGPHEKLFSYDYGQITAGEFLANMNYPTRMYGCHMPQVIDRGIYREMLDTWPEIRKAEIGDEWSLYFNFLSGRYPGLVENLSYCTLAWPMRPDGYMLGHEQQNYMFENFYDSSYDENGLFNGFPKDFTEDEKDYNIAKIKRFENEMKLVQKRQEVYEEYKTCYRSYLQSEPPFLFWGSNGEKHMKLPKYLLLARDGWTQVVMNFAGDLENVDIEIECCFLTMQGHRTIAQNVYKIDLAGRKKIYLPMRTPNSAEEMLLSLQVNDRGKTIVETAKVILI